MVDQHLLLAARRLGSDLRDFKTSLRKTYRKNTHQVTSQKLKEKASGLAETWLANVSQRPEVIANVSHEYLGELNIHFQRILIAAEKATVRKKYDDAIEAILEHYTEDLVVHLMQANAQPATAKPIEAEAFHASAFVGHSFGEADAPLVQAVINTLQALGLAILTGEKPKADKISEKVKQRIDSQHIFVGIFTRRDKLEKKEAWTTSPWVIDEKAYAYGKGRKLILLKEAGVESIGGIQGDYEYLEFTRTEFHVALVKLIQVFAVSVKGLQRE